MRLYLRSTGQEVMNLNAASPKGLQKKVEGYTSILIPALFPGAKHSVQQVRNSKLQRVRN